MGQKDEWNHLTDREREKRNYIFHRIIFLGTRVLWPGLGIFSLNLRISWEFLSFVQTMYVQTLPACVLSLLLTTPHTNRYFKFFQSLRSDQMNHVEEPKELQSKRKKPWVRNLISTVRKTDLSPCSGGTLSPDSPKRLPSSPCSPFSSHGHHRCKPGIPSVPRVPAAVFKNQEAPFLPGCLQLSAQRCGFLASCLLGLMLALRRPASLKEPGTLDTQPACLALGSWFQHLADGYRLWRTLVSWHYFSEGLWFFPFSETSPETDFLVPK